MENSESFEKKCGKYLFEHKRISTIKIKEELPINSTKKESNESSKEDNNLINTIHSSLNKDETISILCDKQNSQILNKIKEGLNIGNDSDDSILISRTIFNSSFKDFANLSEDLNNIDIHNILGFNTAILGESILNQKDNIKIIKNEIHDTKKNYTNIIQKKKNMVILKALIYLNKDDTIYNIDNFKKRLPDLNNTKFEEDYKFEKNVYIRIEDRIREYLNKIKLDKISQLRDIDEIYIQKLMDFPKKSENYKFICIKGIVIGLLNIINDLIGKEYFKLREENKSEELDNGNFFLEIYDKYEIMKIINTFIEKDFDFFINEFKQENNFKFNFVDLITDIFWDYTFRIKEINNLFSNCYGSEKINEKYNETFDKIVDILIKIDMPYKKLIGELLNITCIKREKFYLMEYIIKYKDSSEDKKEKVKEEKKIKLNMSPSCDNIFNKKEEKEEEEEKENNKESEKKEEIQTIQKIRKEIGTSDLDKKLDLDLNLDLDKHFSMDLSKNKLSDKDSLDKVYNYILYGENENEKNKKKKKHKKRKKNKNIILSEEKEGLNDPLVDDFKNFLDDLNSKRSKDYIKKINPKINQDWIKNINNLSS